MVPAYRTIEELFALDADEDGTGEGQPTLSRSEIAEQADVLLRDPEARRAFFRGESE